MVARGYASLSFLHTAAEYINGLDVPTFIYHFGDFDPSGVNAGEKIEQTLREMAPDADITFERSPSRPSKSSSGTCRRGRQRRPTAGRRTSATISVELDAIEPNRLRRLVQQAIEQHLPKRQFKILKAAEESERAIIGRLVRIATSSTTGIGGEDDSEYQ